MNQNMDDRVYSVINVEETIGKTVGLRKPPGPFENSMLNRDAMIQFRESVGGVCIPRGVHRFKSHEEADEWMIHKLAQAAAARS